MNNGDLILARDLLKQLISLGRESATLSPFVGQWEEYLEKLEVGGIELWESGIEGEECGALAPVRAVMLEGED